jgi:sugar (pentulose or hexulose) kinase
MEGVVFSLKECCDLMGSLGLGGDRLVASGGGSQAGLWLQLQADILDRQLIVSTRAEQAAFGAAITAGVGAGLHDGFPAACAAMVRLAEEPVRPDPRRAEVYQKEFVRFKRLYRAIRRF